MLSSGQEWARPRNAFADDAAINFRLQCGNLTMQVVVLTREQTDVQESLRLRQLMPADSAHTRVRTQVRSCRAFSTPSAGIRRNFHKTCNAFVPHLYMKSMISSR